MVRDRSVVLLWGTVSLSIICYDFLLCFLCNFVFFFYRITIFMCIDVSLVYVLQCPFLYTFSCRKMTLSIIYYYILLHTYILITTVFVLTQTLLCDFSLLIVSL